MSPVTKLDDQPAVSLLLVKSSAAKSSTTDLIDLTSPDINGMSRSELMKLIFSLMLLVGQNMSIIQNSFAQNQLDMALIAQNQATTTQTETEQYMNKLSELTSQQQDASKWQEFGEVMKWVGVAVGIIVGALLCETPLGFIVLAAVIGLTASPLFDKAVGALGGAIGDAIGNATVGNILAQIIIIVVLTVLTCGAEGLSTGLTKLATTAGEDVVEGGTQAAMKIVQEGAEEAATQVSTQSTKAAEFAPKFSYAGATVLTQTVTSSNLTGELITLIIEQIPGDEDKKKLAETVLTLLADLLVTIVAFKSASGGKGLLDNLSKVVKNPALLRYGMKALDEASQVATNSAKIGASANQIQQAQTLAELAPIQASINLSQGLYEIFNQITSLSQQNYKSLMDSNKILFSTDFSADWKACVDAQHV